MLEVNNSLLKKRTVLNILKSNKGVLANNNKVIQYVSIH